MRNLMMALGALSLAVPIAAVVPASKAEAQRTYHGKRHYHRSTRRDRDDRGRCRHSSGTTGLVAGGVGGALLGNSILGHGALGTVAGGVGGAFAGRALDRTVTAKDRCR